ncbi:MAG: hypothetical protein IKY98_03475, partial [Alphaproteobacteria bacterium]|nr:hypothetical protein [Alphaproteobacteria bacterium]
MTMKNRDINSDWIFGLNPNMTKGNNDTCVSILCHSGLRAGIQRDDNLMPKAFRFAQSGRSMVEMLGVLAVIGVLSIGGIAGYSYGMDRWRANTTLNDVHLRMVDVMTQVFRGQSDIALSEEWPLTGQAGYLIDLFQNIDSEPSIMVEDVPSSVCKIILKNTPDTQDIFVGTKSGEGVDGAWYTGNNDSICDGDEKEILFALNEAVLGNMDETGAGCQADSDCSADKPYCDTATGVC